VIQIAGIIGGLIGVVMGVNAIRTSEIKLTGKISLTGMQATITGLLTIGLGIALVVFVIVGIPKIWLWAMYR